MILEESDQWIDIRLINTANGAVVASVGSVYAGDGEADPTGRYYYHSSALSSGDSMSRFDLAADTFVKMTPGATGQASAVVMMGDGSKVTSGARVYNAQLGLQFTLPAEVRTGVSLYNGSTVKKNGGIVSYREPLEAGQAVSLVLRYYATIGRTFTISAVSAIWFRRHPTPARLTLRAFCWKTCRMSAI